MAVIDDAWWKKVNPHLSSSESESESDQEQEPEQAQEQDQEPEQAQEQDQEPDHEKEQEEKQEEFTGLINEAKLLLEYNADWTQDMNPKIKLNSNVLLMCFVVWLVFIWYLPMVLH